MGQSASATIVYGYDFNYEVDYYDLPWEKDNFYNLEDWYYDQLGFKGSLNIYDKDNYILNNTTEDPRKKYFQEFKKFKKEHPLPVYEEFYGYLSDTSGGVIICVPNTSEINCYATMPKIFNLDILKVNDKDLELFNTFCNTYISDLIKDKTLGWHLIASYG